MARVPHQLSIFIRPLEKFIKISLQPSHRKSSIKPPVVTETHHDIFMKSFLSSGAQPFPRNTMYGSLISTGLDAPSHTVMFCLS